MVTHERSVIMELKKINRKRREVGKEGAAISSPRPLSTFAAAATYASVVTETLILRVTGKGIHSTHEAQPFTLEKKRQACHRPRGPTRLAAAVISFSVK